MGHIALQSTMVYIYNLKSTRPSDIVIVLVCVSTLCDLHTMKSSNNAFLRTFPKRKRPHFITQGHMGKHQVCSESQEEKGEEKTWHRTFTVFSIEKKRQDNEHQTPLKNGSYE
jgi:hypothetical protein